MQLVSQLTVLMLTFLSATNAYDSIYSREVDDHFARELANDYRRRSDMISMFTTRDLVEELEARLLPRGPVDSATPPSSSGSGGKAGALPPLPLSGFEFCLDQKSFHLPEFLAACEKAKAAGKLVVDQVPDPAHNKGGVKLKIDTSVGGNVANAAEQKSPKSPKAPKSGSPKPPTTPNDKPVS